MISFFLSAMLLAQGIAAVAGESGAVSGILRNAAGMPAVGVRVAAIARPDSTGEVASALVSIAETDAAGRYRLESIPPGQYYIAAGRVDLPTYYPGSLERTGGAVVAIMPGAAIAGIDFIMQDPSVRPVSTTALVRSRSASALDFLISVNLAVQGGGKVPLFGPQGFITLRLNRVSDGGPESALVLNSPVVTRAIPTPAEYRVSVENVPDGYTIKSITYESSDLLKGTLKVSAANAALSFSNVRPNASVALDGMDQLIALLAARSAASSTTNLSILLAGPLPAPENGVRVSGRIKEGDVRPLYLSGSAGYLYSDGTFEFRGVLPGRYVVATADNSRSAAHPLGTSIVVGNRNVEGLELPEVPVLPLYLRSATPSEAGTHGPGVVPLASLQGRVVEEGTMQPFSAGTVTLIGDTTAKYALGMDGQFQVPQLLPGSYSLEINLYSVGIINRLVVIDDKDVTLEITAR